MARELLILRHGEAKKSGHDGDASRELKDRGKRDAQRMGVWLARHDLLPDMVISSPAVRAKRTAEKCCKTAGLRGDVVRKDARVYDASTDDLLQVLREVPANPQRVLLVGHNPSLENLMVLLSAAPIARNAEGRYLRTAALARVRIDADWRDVAAGSAEVLDIVEPDTLPRLFPFPDIHGREERSRPAYYYRQSSVVPFRRTGGGLEVLIISSSKQKHWVIPKGIHDPGLSAQDSAAKEALEEAGIEGRVWDTLIGAYSYPKWDAVCEVEVYPMEVTRVLGETQWAERHRGRIWCGVDEAADKVLNPDVKRMIAGLPDVVGRDGA